MAKAPLLLFVFCTLTAVAYGQTKPLIKADTLKDKASVKTDTSHTRFQLNLTATRFDRIDSADLVLNPAVPIEKYGYVDSADLKMTSCDFEKDANAMVLFDRAEMALGVPDILMERQKRIKIFNDNGKDEANIRIGLDNKYGRESILGVEGETINLVNGKLEYTKLDPKLVYGERTDKNKSALVFTMPNVKAGSIIEYRYVWTRDFSRKFPGWDFQCDLPTRYSQLDIFVNPMLTFKVYLRTNKPFVLDTLSNHRYGHIWAMRDVPSVKDEPFMRSKADVIQNLTFIVSAVKFNGTTKEIFNKWAEIGKDIANDKDFYKPYEQSFHDEGDLLKQAKLLSGDDQKIHFLFNQVKVAMKYNGDENWLSNNGIKAAWKNKSGNAGEINMILYRLLTEAGIKAYPMLVSVRDKGSIIPDFVNYYQLNKLVAYIPVDSTRCYVLDASDKYNVYNEIPFELLNSYGLYLNKEKQDYALVFLKKQEPARQMVYTDAEINPDGSMKGTAVIRSFSYNKSNALELHKTLDEKDYKKFLTDDDNTIRITSLKIENTEVDSLPLQQTVDFSIDLPGSDEKYIYFNPNLFTSLHSNPFISKKRISEIDFGCNNVYTIFGRYKIPAGYKIDALPKSMNLVISDRSITFRRVVGEQDGYIVVNYNITYKKSLYPASGYPDIYAYFKKMNEILNEQIVLKKS